MYNYNYMPSYASITPKPLYYRTNGTGRDTYIDFNNGGLTAEQNIPKFPSIGTFGNNNHLGGRTFEKRPNLGTRISLYKADGTGRDSYCFASKGGFASTSLLDIDGPVYFQPTNSNLSPSKVTLPREMNSDRTLNFFVGQLRSYQKPANEDIFTKNQKQRQRRDMVKQILLKQTQLARSRSMQNLEQLYLQEPQHLHQSNNQSMPKLSPINKQDNHIHQGRNYQSQKSTNENTPQSPSKQELEIQSPQRLSLFKAIQQPSQQSPVNNFIASIGPLGASYDMAIFNSPSKAVMAQKIAYLKQRQHTLSLSQPKQLNSLRKSMSEKKLRQSFVPSSSVGFKQPAVFNELLMQDEQNQYLNEEQNERVKGMSQTMNQFGLAPLIQHSRDMQSLNVSQKDRLSGEGDKNNDNSSSQMLGKRNILINRLEARSKRLE